jgi:crossover junction endodeoxyribonuclease RuvC
MATFTCSDLTLGNVAVVRILGIDPGTQVVGYGCLEIEIGVARAQGALAPMAMRGSNVIRVGGAMASGTKLIAAGVLRLGGKVALPDRLLALADGYRELLAKFAPHELAIEEAFYGKSVQAALRIGEARGVVLAESARARLAVYQFAPARVKRCVAGNGAATKVAVSAMVLRLLQVEPSHLAAEPSDATDALAVAWTRLEQRRSPLLNLAEE